MGNVCCAPEDTTKLDMNAKNNRIIQPQSYRNRENSDSEYSVIAKEKAGKGPDNFKEYAVYGDVPSSNIKDNISDKSIEKIHQFLDKTFQGILKLRVSSAYFKR